MENKDFDFGEQGKMPIFFGGTREQVPPPGPPSGRDSPVSILYESIAGRYRPVRVADGPITARYIFIKNASWARYRFINASWVS